jgi:hypothetical protein
MAFEPGIVTYTVLLDGRVLVAGDAAAQVFDPASLSWSATGQKGDQGYRSAAVLLSDGKVLLAGGRTFAPPDNYTDVDAAEVYDPATGSWTATASMHAKNFPSGAFLLPDGKVLVIGSNSVEQYDPAAGTWTALPVKPGIGYEAAALLSDGAVLMARDVEPHCEALDLYNPRNGSWTTAPSMPVCGNNPSFTPLVDGSVLLAGGLGCNESECVPTGTAQLYVPAGVPLPQLPAFEVPPAFPSPTPVPTPLPAADGPVPPNPLPWTVTVDNRSSEPATMFVASDDGTLRLVGSATPNVVPAGASAKVTFLFPADGGWIFVNPSPGEGGGLVGAGDIGIPGKIVVMADGQVGWLSP